MKNSQISWTDHTFNPWSGCTKVSPGCAHCYAETLSKRNPKTLGKWGAGQPRQRMSDAYWRQPVKWNKSAANFRQCSVCGRREHRQWDGIGLVPCSTPGCLALSETESFPVRQRVFCASLADWLDEEVPIEWLADLLDLIRLTPNLDWLLLTKRPGNWRTRFQAVINSLNGKGNTMSQNEYDLALWVSNWLKGDTWGKTPHHVWLGTTVEDQTRADERIPQLLSIPAKVRFLSCEPLLGPVDLGISKALPVYKEAQTVTHINAYGPGLHLKPPGLGYRPRDGNMQPWVDWVICGGESGPGARPMHPDCARSLRDQCAAAGVPFLFKQWGEWKPHSGSDVWKSVPASIWVHRTTGETWKSSGRSNEVVGNSETQAEAGEWELMVMAGKKAAGCQLDRREHHEFPASATTASVANNRTVASAADGDQ